MIEWTTETGGTRTTAETVQRYQFCDLISSAVLELDEHGSVLTYEEYHPYGSTSFAAGRSGAEVS